MQKNAPENMQGFAHKPATGGRITRLHLFVGKNEGNTKTPAAKRRGKIISLSGPIVTV
jgi:hypothetical protein